MPASIYAAQVAFRSTILFEDIDYGQWGLRLFGAEAAVVKTIECRGWMGDELRDGDLVIGEFLGDLELLVCATQDNGRLMVSLPLDPRESWYDVGSTVVDFLEMYVDSVGQKFWVRRE